MSLSIILEPQGSPPAQTPGTSATQNPRLHITYTDAEQTTANMEKHMPFLVGEVREKVHL